MLLVLVSTTGLVMIIFAVFVSRPGGDSDDASGNKGVLSRNADPAQDSNPYSTPVTH